MYKLNSMMFYGTSEWYGLASTVHCIVAGVDKSDISFNPERDSTRVQHSLSL